MFTGIIEALAKLEHCNKEGSNIHFTFSSSITNQLKINQSVSHNGVCLTVVNIDDNKYTVTAIHETLQLSNLGQLQPGCLVNLERCMPANGRFDGHMVQGHVDTTAVCTNIKDLNGSWEFSFEYDKNQKNVTVLKGSITVNGVSLTVSASGQNTFSVCIIPYTIAHTNFKQLTKGSTVNIEFDIIGKYAAKLLTTT